MVDGGGHGRQPYHAQAGALIFLCSLPEGVREGRARVDGGECSAAAPNARRANAVAPPRLGSPPVSVATRRCCAQRPRKRAYGLRWATVTRANGSRLIARVGRASFGGPGHPEASPGGAVTLRWPKPHTSPGLGPSHGVGRPLVRAWAAGAMSVPRVRLHICGGWWPRSRRCVEPGPGNAPGLQG